MIYSKLKAAGSLNVKWPPVIYVGYHSTSTKIKIIINQQMCDVRWVVIMRTKRIWHIYIATNTCDLHYFKPPMQIELYVFVSC